ncbi:mechanosensitive ion channel domain-containing protein [Mangrovicoccus sp. HB161399]|uniref:mechanosensitive ion channel domain-containing protein n=1 Tax=Mangrovicoccus sp. HB161399 TaxID=2720392 RepID=UPI00155328ED|nr:mechanosensitive ion channel domain-containing protein [Mangrovicoccus sp. HB161399]
MKKMLFRLLPILLIAFHVTQAPAQSLLPSLQQGSAQQESAQDQSAGSSGGDAAAAGGTAQGGDLGVLLDVLQDDAARQKLIEALSQAAPAAAGQDGAGQQDATAQDGNAASADAAASGTEAAASADGTDEGDAGDTFAAPDIHGFAQQAAEIMTDFANDLQNRSLALLADVKRLTELPAVLSDSRRARIMEEAPRLLATIVATVAIYRVLRILARAVVRPPETRTIRRVAKAVAIQSVLRLVGLLLAWVAGYALASAFGGGSVAVVQAYYLNAFLVVGAITLVLSLFVSYSPRDVTFSRLPQHIDTTIFRSVKRVSGLLVYTLVAVVPIARVWSNFTIASSLRSVLLTVTMIFALFAIRRLHRSLQDWLEEKKAEEERQRSQSSDEDEFANLVSDTTQTIWNKAWPPLATLYVLTCYWIAITRPYGMLDVLGKATLWSVGALALFLVCLRILSKAGDAAFPVPKGKGRLLQLFIERVNGFLPTLSVLAGLAGVIVAIVWELAAWDLAHFENILQAERIWGLGTALLIVLIALAIWASISAWIDDRLTTTSPFRTVSARQRTLLSLARNAITIAVIVFAGMMALSELGINIAPLIAGAGVIGLAIGFGAQKLVQDIITGVFIQLENAINEGDVVTVAGISGAVESLTIRSVGIRDLSGTYHLVPFSAVDTVSNFMRRFSYHVEVAGISYGSDIDLARDAMFEAFENVRKGQFGAFILGDLEMHGVVGLGDSAVNIRARIKTLPGKQWDVGRAYTEQVKKVFDKHGIEIPFPHRELKMPNELFERLHEMAQQRGTVISSSATPVHDPSHDPKPLGPTAGPARDDGPDAD